MTLPEEERYIITKEELLARISMTLGGRSAEEIVFGHQSTGAADDLEKVSDLARSLVCRWGMTEELGPISYDQGGGNPFLGREITKPDHMSEETASAIDNQVRKIVSQCHEQALEILRQNRDLLDRMAELLMEKETLDKREFEEAIQRFATVKPPPLKVPLAQEVEEEAEDAPAGDTTVTESGPVSAPNAPGDPLPPPHPVGA